MLYLIGQFVLCVICGVALDALITLHLRAVSSRKAFWAAVLSCVITVVSYKIISEFIETKSMLMLSGFAFGNAIGTYLAVKVGKEKEADDEKIIPESEKQTPVSKVLLN